MILLGVFVIRLCLEVKYLVSNPKCPADFMECLRTLLTKGKLCVGKMVEKPGVECGASGKASKP